jgi:hypothetical protein
MNAPHNKSMDVSGKQRLCWLACLFIFNLTSGGLPPRHLSRWTFRVDLQRDFFKDVMKSICIWKLKVKNMSSKLKVVKIKS